MPTSTFDALRTLSLSSMKLSSFKFLLDCSRVSSSTTYPSLFEDSLTCLQTILSIAPLVNMLIITLVFIFLGPNFVLTF